MARKDPDRVELEGVTATPMHERGTNEHGQRYWRARTTGADRRTVWAGWGTRAEVSAVVGDLVRKGIPSRPSAPGAVRSIADLLGRWKDQQEQRRKAGRIAARTLVNYRQGAGYWLEAIGDVSVRALTRTLVEDTLTEWQAEGVAARTCKLGVDVLAMAVAWGARRELCPAVELSRLEALKIRDDEHVANVTTPEPDQVAALLEQLGGWYRDLVALQALTGARIGEVAALHVRDWDRAGAELTISGRDDHRERRGKVKPRLWPVTGELAQELERLAGDRPGDERLVVGPPREFVPQLARRIREGCDDAKVPRFTSHGIRRMVATLLLASGEDHKRVSELTGHSVTTLLRFYARPSRAQLRQSVARARLSTRRRAPGKVYQLVGAQDPGTPPGDTDGNE